MSDGEEEDSTPTSPTYQPGPQHLRAVTRIILPQTHAAASHPLQSHCGPPLLPFPPGYQLPTATRKQQRREWGTPHEFHRACHSGSHPAPHWNSGITPRITPGISLGPCANNTSSGQISFRGIVPIPPIVMHTYLLRPLNAPCGGRAVSLSWKVQAFGRALGGLGPSLVRVAPCSLASHQR